jgi:hypothetical protein
MFRSSPSHDPRRKKLHINNKSRENEIKNPHPSSNQKKNSPSNANCPNPQPPSYPPNKIKNTSKPIQ